MSQNTSADILRFAGDVNVEKVVITSLVSKTKFNISNQLLSISIYEDIFSPFITGTLVFRESYDFVTNFPFVGEEILELKIYTPTFNTTGDNSGIIEGKFYVYKMSDRLETAERNMTYKVSFISLDAIGDINVKLSRAFSGKISDIAKTLLTSEECLATKRPVIVEETKNKTKYISNFWSPIRNINYILEQAQNNEGSPTYVFFENRMGYNFVSLDYLNTGKLAQEFIYDNSQDDISPDGGSKRNILRDYKRIYELDIPVSYDFMDKATSGTYASKMIFSDLATKEYFELPFSYLDNWGDEHKQVRLNKYPLSSRGLLINSNAKITSDIAHSYMFTDYQDVTNIKTIQTRISRIKQAQGQRLNITVAGRTDYTVGQIVTVKTFQAEPTRSEDSDSDQKDRLISGVYLIAAINHTIDREKHECYMELVKDSLSVDLNKGGV